MLFVSDLPAWQRAQGFSIPNKGDSAIGTIMVHYFPTGRGPDILGDYRFSRTAESAFRMAVLAAAQAINYDARFIQARLVIPVAIFHDPGFTVDGPSAGVAWAVAVASAILGDPLRQDVCLTGTIDRTLLVGQVGGVEYKVEGCHTLHYNQMIVPEGQKTFAASDKALSYSMRLIEAHTLADAYLAATGQFLRAVDGKK